MQRTPLLCLILLAMGQLTGCLGDLDRVSQVKDLRFIALRTDPPELILTSTTQPIPPFSVSALVVDPTGETGTLPVLVWACPPTVSARCDVVEDRVLIKQFDSAPAELSVDVTLTTSFMLKVLEQDKYRGFGGLDVQLHWQFGTIHASKRMVFGYPEPAGRLPNRNPKIKDITFNGKSVFEGDPMSFEQDQEVEVVPVPTDDSQENYPLVTFSGEVRDERERITYAWFGTDGKFDPEVTGGRKGILGTGETDVDPKTTWTAPDDLLGFVTFWVVIRDERGGANWRSFKVNVTPKPTQ